VVSALGAPNRPHRPITNPAGPACAAWPTHHRAVWEPSNEPNAVRAGWAGESWRCYSLTPASVDGISMHRFPASLRGSRVAAGSHSRHSMRGHPSTFFRAPPMPDPPRLYGWRSLHRIHSDLWRSLSPYGHRRLSAPADRQLSFPPDLAFARHDGTNSPAWPGTPLTPPVKETLSTPQNAFRLVRLPQAFTCGPTPLALSVKITRWGSHTDFAFYPPPPASAKRWFPSG